LSEQGLYVVHCCVSNAAANALSLVLIEAGIDSEVARSPFAGAEVWCVFAPIERMPIIERVVEWQEVAFFEQAASAASTLARLDELSIPNRLIGAVPYSDYPDRVLVPRAFVERARQALEAWETSGGGPNESENVSRVTCPPEESD